ncbi:MAG TPA: SCO family protein [Vicinamibacteria bacterium]|nr:SCO family protein [Vicinamibacteria bacterium]
MRRAALCVAAVLAGGVAQAQVPAGMPASSQPQILREVGYEQRLGEQVPLDLVLRAETGATVRLRDALAGKPTVLSLVYYECPMLCTLTLNGLVGALTALPFEPGRDFSLVTVSFDERETPAQAARRKQAYVARYGRPGAEKSWRFLTGEKETLRRLTDAVGFRYAWDERTRQFAHPAGVVVLTPDGRIARYLFGVEYAPKDLRLGLVEAGEGRIGSPVDRLLLYCYQYDPAQGRYGAAVMRLVRLGGVATLLGVGGFVFVALRRERRRSAS